MYLCIYIYMYIYMNYYGYTISQSSVISLSPCYQAFPTPIPIYTNLSYTVNTHAPYYNVVTQNCTIRYMCTYLRTQWLP